MTADLNAMKGDDQHFCFYAQTKYEVGASQARPDAL